MKRVAAGAGLVALLASPGAASAGAGPAGANDDEAVRLLQGIERDAAALSTGDCAEACKALESMRRAAARLCELDPGAPCATARARVEDASRRVREACETCALAFGAPRELPVASPPPAAAPRDGATTTAEGAPRKGGCASCVTASARATSLADAAALAAATALAVAVIARRRRRP